MEKGMNYKCRKWLEKKCVRNNNLKFFGMREFHRAEWVEGGHPQMGSLISRFGYEFIVMFKDKTTLEGKVIWEMHVEIRKLRNKENKS
jgi:hypothetical protein